MTQTLFVMRHQPFQVKSEASAGLLAKVRPRDANFADLVDPYISGLSRRARRLTGSPADAEDVTQESLLKAWLRLHQFSGSQDRNGGDFGAWLSRIATNTAFDLLRRRHPCMSLDEQKDPPGQTLGSAIPALADNPEQLCARREQRRLLANAICQLPPDLRQICLLRDVLYYSTQEVAEQLRVSAVAVRLRLFRARRRLRDILQTAFRLNPELRRGGDTGVRKRAGRFASLNAATNCACGD
jgi:RNA polymerase sigma-70 factor (ECF subfamily)